MSYLAGRLAELPPELADTVMAPVVARGGPRGRAGARRACRAMRDLWDTWVTSVELRCGMRAAPENLLLPQPQPQQQQQPQDEQEDAWREALIDRLLLLPRLTRLVVLPSQQPVHVAWPSLLPRLPEAARLTSLCLAGPWAALADAGARQQLCAALGSMRALAELDLSRTLAPGQGGDIGPRRVLEACPPGLRSLDLMHNAGMPADELAVALQRLTCLTCLRLSNPSVAAGGGGRAARAALAASLGALAGLRELAVGGFVTTDLAAALGPSGRLAGLTRLEVGSPWEDGAAPGMTALVRAVGSLAGLRHLSLVGVLDCMPAPLPGQPEPPTIAGLTQLTALSWDVCMQASRLPAGMPRMPCLRELELRNVLDSFSFFGMPGAGAGAGGIASLTLDALPGDDDAVSALGRAVGATLERLRLDRLPDLERAQVLLGSLPRLRDLELWTDSAQGLTTLPSALTRLRLCTYRPPDQPVAPLVCELLARNCRCIELLEIDVRHPSQLPQLLDALTALKSLVRLVLVVWTGAAPEDREALRAEAALLAEQMRPHLPRLEWVSAVRGSFLRA